MGKRIRQLQVSVSQKLPTQFTLVVVFFVMVICVISISWYKVVKNRAQALPTAYIDDISIEASALLDNTTPKSAVGDALTQAINPATTENQATIEEPALPQQNSPLLATTEESHWRKISILPGQTLANIFSSLGLSNNQLIQLLALKNAGKYLRNLSPKLDLELEISSTGKLLELTYPVDGQLLVVTQQNDIFQEEWHSAGIEKRIIHIHGSIEHSFINSVIKAGVSEKAVVQLAKLLSQQINFSRDFQPGDEFNIVYTAYFLNNKRLPSGNILAAQLSLQNGKQLTALRYTDKKGQTQYYKPNSASFRPGFLRYPLHFSHVSSRFSPHGRYHPLLHIFRPHLGIDLAAPVGTPVESVGDGKISFIGRHGGYGKAVIINHGHGYTSLYAHLSRYPHGLHVGSSVREGQTIGFVGATGLATGPHCHYEFRYNGVHYDPARVKLPGSMPLTDSDRYAFLSQARVLIAELNDKNNDAIIAGQDNPELTKLAKNDQAISNIQ